MATDQGSSENQDWLAVKNWRNIQKEREREKRRMRDRERRQSMSLEERERHLARRRRNYQLRRQRALNNAAAKTGHQVLNTGSEAENENSNNNLQVVSVVPELEFHSDSAPRFVSTKNSISVDYGAEARRIRPVKYPYPKGLHFYQIRHLARLLNSRSGEVHDHHQQVGAEVTDKNYDVTKSSGKLWRRIRLIDMKRLARALNSVPKGQPNAANNNSGERIEEVEGNAEQMICSSKSLTPEQSNEAICDVQQVNAYSGVFAP
ncbi:PREDICTED: uncharacterized protein LOC109185624 [Ipomoea nil]|uniref:uncharacterized protein LOC109185624 n=1 Tax=Ipomoea nil TaxID=35883 RepID=UPI000901A3CC|nr:PREDICTED: uncharacterized protein LOC109185624 [Ipomoea nil]XP_019191126.1 PREDICTED: uncharacterized protein LOC109185624 [Ipomoea nil]XP_019191127.1 PREDICTED: uncharacterized protein LOC109185624 [Ipomoea nil]